MSDGAVPDDAPPPTFSLPAQFLSASFDFAPLTRTFEAVNARLVGLECTCDELKAENRQLTREIRNATERAEVSQRQYEGLFDVVGKLNHQFSGLQSSFISRDEVLAKVQSTVSLVDAVNERCDDLYEKKMDAHSVALENKVKEIAYETSTRHISARDKEQREWFTLHMGDTETRLTELILTTQRDVRGHVENELDALRRGASDSAQALQKVERDVDSSLQLLVGLDKAFVTKLEAHERQMDTMEAVAQREVDSLRRNVKGFLHAFGLDLTRLMASVHDGELFEDAEDAQRMFNRSVALAQRTHDNFKAWRVVRALHPGVGAALAVEPPEETALDLRNYELKRDERSRIANHRQKALAERLTNVDATIPLSKAGELILAGPLMLQGRHDSLGHFKDALHVTQKEIAADFGSQVQTLQRELRGKIGSQRVVELIEQYAAQIVKTETDKFAADISRISEGMMHREDILTALTGKADARVLTFKADVATVSTQLEEVEAKLAEMRSTVTQQLQAAIDTKAKDLAMQKLDRRDPTYLSIVNLVQSGRAFNTPSMNASGSNRCVTCGVDPSGSASGDATPTRGTRSDADDLRQADEQRMQATQERIHAAQMSGGSSPRTGRQGSAGARPGSASARGGGAGDGPVTDWVQQIDARFKGRMIVPAPPPASKQGGTTGK